MRNLILLGASGVVLGVGVKVPLLLLDRPFGTGLGGVALCEAASLTPCRETAVSSLCSWDTFVEVADFGSFATLPDFSVEVGFTALLTIGVVARSPFIVLIEVVPSEILDSAVPGLLLGTAELILVSSSSISEDRGDSIGGKWDIEGFVGCMIVVEDCSLFEMVHGVLLASFAPCDGVW